MQRSTSFLERVRRHLAALGRLDQLEVRAHGPDVVQVTPTPKRVGKATARLTALGHGAFGLSFQEGGERWPSIALVDTFEEIVSDLLAAIEPPTQHPGFAAE